MDVSLGMVLEARERLKGTVRRTDVVPCKVLNAAEREVFLKTECLQNTGSFKVRGAYNKIAQLTAEERARGVIASSAGNHAQGVALAAKMFGAPAVIVMPQAAPLAKISATRELGAEVILHGNVYDDAYKKACEVCEERGMTFIHPFDDPLVIAGQGSIGLEIMDDLPDVDAILVPIGGGGLVSGIAVAVKTLHPNVKIIGVEASGAASMSESVKRHCVAELESAHTIADGIAVKKPGELTYSICEKLVDEIVTVDEDEIAGAILLLLEKCKIVAEGAGATPVAAIQYGKVKTKGKLAAVISGGNIDVNMLQRIIDKGLMKAGRLTQLHTVIEDRPGHLHQLLSVIASTGANVVSIQHERTNVDTGFGTAILQLVLETQNRNHLERMLATMNEAGYKVW